jgi:hypothetical protein
MYIKKITTGNPLANFHLWKELDEYNVINTDQHLAEFYHKMLDRYEDRPLVYRFILAMISFSVCTDINSKISDIWN